MGAEAFEHISRGKGPVDAAFRAAVTQAQYDYGHAGYSGTIAEKDEYTIIQKEPMTLEDAGTLAGKLMDDDDVRIRDKWGAAGAIPLVDGGWLFFGWASS